MAQTKAPKIYRLQFALFMPLSALLVCPAAFVASGTLSVSFVNSPQWLMQTVAALTLFAIFAGAHFFVFVHMRYRQWRSDQYDRLINEIRPKRQYTYTKVTIGVPKRPVTEKGSQTLH